MLGEFEEMIETNQCLLDYFKQFTKDLMDLVVEVD